MFGLRTNRVEMFKYYFSDSERVKGHRRGWGVQDEGKYADVMLEHSIYIDWPLLKLS